LIKYWEGEYDDVNDVDFDYHEEMPLKEMMTMILKILMMRMTKRMMKWIGKIMFK